jgi:hypothetical protein
MVNPCHENLSHHKVLSGVFKVLIEASICISVLIKNAATLRKIGVTEIDHFGSYICLFISAFSYRSVDTSNDYNNINLLITEYGYQNVGSFFIH